MLTPFGPTPSQLLGEMLHFWLHFAGLLHFLFCSHLSDSQLGFQPTLGAGGCSSSPSALPPHAEAQLSCLQVVFDQYREGDVVWVQDYHLMLLPALLKQRYPRMKVVPHKCTPVSLAVHCKASRT